MNIMSEFLNRVDQFLKESHKSSQERSSNPAIGLKKISLPMNVRLGISPFLGVDPRIITYRK